MANNERDIWRDIEAEYISGDATLAVLSKLHNVDYGYLRQKCFKQEWSTKRAAYREANLKALEAEIKSSALANKAEFDAKTIRACEVASAHAAVMLTMHGKAIQDNDASKMLSGKQIKELLDIVQISQATIYRTWDIPLPIARTQDIGRDKSPSDSIEDEIALAIEDLHLDASEHGGNGNGNGNGSRNGHGGNGESGGVGEPGDAL